MYADKDGYIYEVCVEITRQCNFSCGHCLRGEAQNQDLDVKKFIEVLV